MAFDVDAAAKAGYSPGEIADFMAQGAKFDAEAARKSGYSDKEIISHLAGPAPARPTGEQVTRGVGIFGQGINDSLASMVGGIPDLVGTGLRAVGLPSSAPGQYTALARKGINYLAGNPDTITPETTTEKVALGAGRGVGDAASVLLPATAIARLAPAGGMAANVAGQLAASPAIQLASGATGGAVGEATDSPLLGTAAALAVPLVAGGVSRAITPVRAAQSPQRAALVAAAEREGIPLSPAQTSGSRSLANIEGAFASLPLTSGGEQAMREATQKAYNRAILKRAGVSGDTASPAVLADAQDAIGGTIGAIAERNTAKFSKPLTSQMAGILTDVEQNAAPEVAHVVRNRIMQIADKVDPTSSTMAGRAVRELDSAIGEQIRNSQGDVRRYLRDVQQTLRAALAEGAGPADAAALAKARRQYANLVVVENGVGRAGAGAAVGDVSPSGLRAAVASDRRGYATGRGDLNELARTGEAVIRSPIPNSGTPERTMMINLLTGGGAFGTALGTGMTPQTAGLLAASTLIPKAAQSAYYSRAGKAYLNNGLLRDFNPVGASPGILAARTRAMIEGR